MIVFDETTIKNSKRNDLSNPITVAFANFERGCKALGLETKRIVGDYDGECDAVVVFGSTTRRKKDTERAIAIQKHRDKGRKIISFDSGLFGTFMRDCYNVSESYMFRIGIGDCVGGGDFRCDNSPKDRYEAFKHHYKFSEKTPIIDKTKPILFLLQTERGWQYDNLEPYYLWARRTLESIRLYTDRPVVLRAHPSVDRNPTAMIAKGFDNVTIEYADRTRRGVVESIRNSSAVVTHSSSAVCESIVEGIPTFALDSRCVLYKYCQNDLSKINFDVDWSFREQLLYDMAYMSFHINELKQPEIARRFV